jgi:hypothetical protein
MADVLPITFIPRKDVRPCKYVIHVHSIVCRHCGTTQTYTDGVFAVESLPPRMQSGKGVIHSVPVDQIDYNLPVDVSHELPRHTPYCQHCIATADLSHLPDPRNTEEWKRQYSPSWVGRDQPAAAKATSRNRKSPTIDDLLNI